MAAKKKKPKEKPKAGGKTKRPPSAKGYLERLQAMDKSGGFAMYGDDSDIIPVIDEWVSTGCVALDRQLGGGWPIGAISELRAWEGVGKAQPLDSPVLTPDGFVPMSEVGVGSFVIGSDGLPTKVLGVYPRGSRQVWEVTFSDGATTECTDDHLWSVRNYHGTERVASLRELRGSLKRKGGAPKFYVPLVEPVRFNGSRQLPIHPYLLGLLLGDGGFTSGVKFHKAEEDLVESVRLLVVGEDTVSPITHKGVLRGVSICGGATRAVIEKLGLFGKKSTEKFIPSEYLHTAPVDRLALLQGLLDTDGNVTKCNSVEFSSSSKKLAVAVRYLAWSLGAVATFSSRIPKFTSEGRKKSGARSYRLLIRFPPHLPVPVRSRKHIAKWKEDKRIKILRSIVAVKRVGNKDCQCIRVANNDGLYVTNNFIVTHNSTVADQSLAYMQSIGGIAALVDTEKSRDRKWSERLGVDLSKLLMKPCDTLEGSFEAIDALLNVQATVKVELNKGRKKSKREIKPPPMLIIWDSLGSSPPKAELDGAPGDNHVGIAARRTKQSLRRLTQRLYKLRVGLVIINHVYTPIGFGSTQLQSPGGGGIKFHTHVRAHMSRTSSLKIGEQVVGHTIEFKNLKNRILGVQQPVEAALIYGVGVDNAYSLFLWGQENGVAEGHRWVIRQGQWSWLYPPGEEPISFQRQYLGLGEILRQRPDLYQWMLAHFMGRYENEKNSEENEREETEA